MFFLFPSIVVIPVISEHLWWCFYDHDDDYNDDYDDSVDHDDDEEDDKPADPAMTGLVGPFPPPAAPLLYWNSTQAFDHHHAHDVDADDDEDDDGKGNSTKIDNDFDLSWVSWLAVLHNVHPLELNLKKVSLILITS